MHDAARLIERLKALALRDSSILARASYGRACSPGTPRAQIAQAMSALAAHDIAAIVTKARADYAARCEARKAQWAQTHR